MPPPTPRPHPAPPPCNIKQCGGGAVGGDGGGWGTQTNAGEWQVCICPYQQAPISLTNR